MERLRELTAPRWATSLALAVLAVAVSVGAYKVVTMDRSVHPGRGPVSLGSSSASPTAPRIRAVFFGDAIVAGANAGRGNPTFCDVSSHLLGWSDSLFGYPGSGYTTAGAFRGGRDYIARIQQLRGYSVDVVVIEGGRNDVGAPLAALRDQAGKVIRAARLLVPRARLVLMGPYSVVATPPAALVAADATLRDLAAADGIPYVDPLAEQWITGGTQAGAVGGSYIASDGLYPNAAGHDYFGHRLAEDLTHLLPHQLVPGPGA